MNPAQNKTGGLKPPTEMSERRVALICGMLAGLGPLSLALFTPAMPTLTAVFATSEAAVKGTLSAYFAGYAGAQLVSGPLSDRYGRKSTVQAFLLLYLAGTLGTLVAGTMELLLWSRSLQGIGAAAGLVMSRAIVRDLFTGDSSSRVLNLSNIILGAGPMLAPAIGGGAILLAGWRAPFFIMFAIGVALAVLVKASLVETRPRQLASIASKGTLSIYLSLLKDSYFLWSSATISCAVATFYAQSTVLSFIVMGQLGFSAAQFGLLMLFISSGYFMGAIVVGSLIARQGAAPLVPYGLAMLFVMSLALAVLLVAFPLSLASVALPISAMTFANAFVLPGMYTASLAPFAKIAGAASALSGFMTMALGFLASVMMSLVGNPAHALAITAPTVAAPALIFYVLWRRSRPNEYREG